MLTSGVNLKKQIEMLGLVYSKVSPRTIVDEVQVIPLLWRNPLFFLLLSSDQFPLSFYFYCVFS